MTGPILCYCHNEISLFHSEVSAKLAKLKEQGIDVSIRPDGSLLKRVIGGGDKEMMR